MILIIGLGNPGLKFKNTRHNLGFEIVNRLKKKGAFSAWQNKKRLKAKISHGKIENQKIILAKPQTFMNQSGRAVNHLMKFYKIPLKNLWVVYDDIDLVLGKIKIKKKSRSGGHKGVQSIIDELGTKSFSRLKIGVGLKQPKIDSKKFVLQKLTKSEREVLKTSQKESVVILLTELNSKDNAELREQHNGKYKNYQNN